MADWLDEPEEDSEDTTGVAQALADPRGTFGGPGGEVPDQTPQVDEQPHEANSPDANADGDYEASKLAGAVSDGKDESSTQEDAMPFLTPAAAGSKASDDYLPEDSSGADVTPAAGAGADSPREDDPSAGFDMKAPSVPQAPNLPDAQDERDQLAHQIASFNPNDYKPSGGRRALAAIAGGLTAFGSRSPEAGMRVGESVLDAPLNKARAVEAQKEAALRQGIASTEANRQDQQQDYNNSVSNYNLQERNLTNQARVAEWKALADQRKAVAQQKLSQVDPRTLGPVDPNNPFGEWQGKNAKGEVIRGLEPPPAVQKDPRYIAQQRRSELAQMTKDGIKLTPQETKFYLINGKLAEPSQHTTISIRENPDGSPVQPRGGHGGGMTSSLNDRIIKEKNVAMSKAQEQHASGAMSDDEYQQALQDAQDNYEQRIEEATGQKQPHVTVNDKFQFVDDSGKVLPASGSSQAKGVQPAQPQRQQQPQQEGPGAGKTFSVSRWQAANPKGDANAAKQMAQSQGYKVVP